MFDTAVASHVIGYSFEDALTFDYEFDPQYSLSLEGQEGKQFATA